MAFGSSTVGKMSERILVVGGTGFIGRHVMRQAAELGLAVTCLSLNQPEEDPANGVEFLAADFTCPDSLQTILHDRPFEYVINCGGYIDHALFGKGGGQLIVQHFDAVRLLVEALDRECLRGFVQLGSSDEYGSQPAPQSEALREAPISPYAFGKAAATQFLQMLYRTEKFPAVVARLFLTYGPGQEGKRFLPQIIAGCLSGKLFPASEGKQLRDFCHVDDVAAGLLRAARTPEVHGEVINFASGEPVSIREMVELVCQLIGGGQPEFGAITYRPGENMALYADVSKARRLMSWQPAISLEAGLDGLIEWGRGQGWGG